MTTSGIFVLALLTTLGAAPTFSAVAKAQDRDDRRQEQRIYDSDHKDYHEWNADEDRRYREYLNEHHQKYHEFSKLSAKKQRDYWKWRHDHDDKR